SISTRWISNMFNLSFCFFCSDGLLAGLMPAERLMRRLSGSRRFYFIGLDMRKSGHRPAPS
ncbi:MAG: hypothetical protein ACRD5Z_16375, partial [Bryobacteraceae bacterium]